MSAKQFAILLAAAILTVLVTTVVMRTQFPPTRVCQKCSEREALNERIESAMTRLAQLEENLADRVADDRSTLVVTLVEDSPQATPVPNVHFRLRGRAYANSEEMATLIRETNRSGQGLWEALMPGQYSLLVHSANGYDTNMHVELVPGKKKQLTIRCPAADTRVDVNFEVPWPDDLKGKGLVVAYGVSCKIEVEVDGRPWRGDSMRVCLADDGTVLGTPDRLLVTGDSRGEGYPRATNDIYRIEAVPNEDHGRKWLPGEYGFWHLLVLVPQDEGEIVGERRYREVWGYWSREPDTRHVAKAGETPTWTVPLPASLIEHVRKCTEHPEQPADAPETIDSIF